MTEAEFDKFVEEEFAKTEEESRLSNKYKPENWLRFGWMNDHEAIKYLLPRIKNVDRSMSDGTTVLMMFSRYGETSMVNLLLEHGANVNKKDMYGKTALSYASSPEMVSFLLEHGAEKDNDNI